MGFNDQEIVILSGAHALGVRSLSPTKSSEFATDSFVDTAMSL